MRSKRCLHAVHADTRGGGGGGDVDGPSGSCLLYQLALQLLNRLDAVPLSCQGVQAQGREGSKLFCPGLVSTVICPTTEGETRTRIASIIMCSIVSMRAWLYVASMGAALDHGMQRSWGT